jgi:hypothetical protein
MFQQQTWFISRVNKILMALALATFENTQPVALQNSLHLGPALFLQICKHQAEKTYGGGGWSYRPIFLNLGTRLR